MSTALAGGMGRLAMQYRQEAKKHHVNSDARRGEAAREMSLHKTISSKELLLDAQGLIITHAGEEYRLRITSNNKLILTK